MTVERYVHPCRLASNDMTAGTETVVSIGTMDLSDTSVSLNRCAGNDHRDGDSNLSRPEHP